MIALWVFDSDPPQDVFGPVLDHLQAEMVSTRGFAAGILGLEIGTRHDTLTLPELALV
jgi:hypothetical protein